MAKVTEVSSSKSFGGFQKVYSHESKELKCQMKFSFFVPPKAVDGEKCPVLYFLSGLTCTEQNFITKCGFQRYASENNLIVVGPDTSPRGVNIPGEDDDYDFGSGAGFYVNATQDPWKNNYRMFSYVTEELPALIESEFAGIVEEGKRSISGHSMGGHGALICTLKNPGFYTSTSAFSPINNPCNVPWGQKAFKGYLGADEETWKEWDATYLARNYSGPPTEILVDQGTADQFLERELQGKNFIDSCSSSGLPLIYRLQEGYDHSYWFVGTFIEEHIKYHADALRK